MSRRAAGWLFSTLLIGSLFVLAGLPAVRGEKPGESKPTAKKPPQAVAENKPAEKKPEAKKPTEPHGGPINVNVPHISTDKTVKIDYDIAYVRAGRAGDTTHKRYYTDKTVKIDYDIAYVRAAARGIRPTNATTPISRSPSRWSRVPT